MEQQILMSHSSSFLVKCFFSFYSAQHVFFALEFMPGGDLAAMLSACGCVQARSVACGLVVWCAGLQCGVWPRMLTLSVGADLNGRGSEWIRAWFRARRRAICMQISVHAWVIAC